jgi:hypothetical protein
LIGFGRHTTIRILVSVGTPARKRIDGTCSINRLDERRLADGRYQFSHGMANGRQSKRKEWFAQVSVQAAIWILRRYVGRLAGVTRRRADFTDDDIVISKADLRKILLSFVKRLDG